MFYFVSDSKLKIIPSEVLTFSNDNGNFYSELMASLTFINDYKDPIAFKVTKHNTNIINSSLYS